MFILVFNQPQTSCFNINYAWVFKMPIKALLNDNDHVLLTIMAPIRISYLLVVLLLISASVIAKKHKSKTKTRTSTKTKDKTGKDYNYYSK